MTVAATSIAAFRALNLTEAQKKTLAVYKDGDELRDQDVALRRGVPINEVSGRIGDLLKIGRLLECKDRGTTERGNDCRKTKLNPGAGVRSGSQISATRSLLHTQGGRPGSAQPATPFKCECRYGAHTTTAHCLAHWSRQIRALGQRMVEEKHQPAHISASITKAINERAPAALRDELHARRNS